MSVRSSFGPGNADAQAWVESEELMRFAAQHGITIDSLMSEMGGSP
jgi:hypothetical protein